MTKTHEQILTSAADLSWAPKHPGHFIKKDILEPHGFTQQRLADALGVARRSVNELVGGKRELTVEMARRLSALTGQSPHYWRELQMQYDLWKSRQETPSFDIEPLEDIVAPVAEQDEERSVA